ncbi:unnamed protein product [Mytilus edulis]|uniref:Peptidase A2 domain-containing protein n=1 Tax=Mytilus edulis TaxID=6550 RepID=A0A8S3SV50_MYTED|nr:unnamed protein product [Mytilus edulis]
MADLNGADDSVSNLRERRKDDFVEEPSDGFKIKIRTSNNWQLQCRRNNSSSRMQIHQEDDDDDMFMRNNEPVGEETSGEAIIEMVESITDYGGIELADPKALGSAISLKVRAKNESDNLKSSHSNDIIDTSRADKGPSLYVPVEINKIKIDMLIDTGSPVTILSENLIKKVDLGSSGLSRVESTLSAADGNKMKIKGQAVCEIKIGNNEFQHKIIFTKLGEIRRHSRNGLFKML